MKKSILTVLLAAFLFSSCSQKQKEYKQSTQVVEPTAETQLTDTPSKTEESKTMYPKLSTYIELIVSEMAAIPQERKDQLKKIALYIQTKTRSNELANLTFICTHNSRRSHLSQIWAATAAAYYGIENGIKTYSGGTETTAFNSRAVSAIERAGFKVKNPGGDNPHYQVTYADEVTPMECFSKKYDDPSNANENFAAVMTCSDADKNCPYIPGASLRIPIPYEDPKESDDTDQEVTTYDERCKQIATEMFFIMSQVKA